MVDGVELLRMIRDGEIKENTNFIDLGGNVYRYKNYNFISRHGETNLIHLLENKFKILSSEDEEIDIDSLEEINYYSVISAVEGKFEENVNDALKANSIIINDLIKAVKQINRKVEGK